ncbi:unnamed protein product [Notodromas monacha]|uniref:Metaxin glutathione S-transferase domain-containing protein n=1 Tax=Notodromas monacha TaxID=399045 RepID=A0A7R9BI71_9CRUS|nr:unnamed protein product [Notodromas monacha]CAG0915680.1 unnamed protein product [Notodromas monacha]
MTEVTLTEGVSKVKAQGMGVHKPEEIEGKGHRDIQVLSDLLADKEFFFGTEPALLDVVAFSVLSQFVCFDPEVEFPLRTWIEQNTPNVISFVDRMKEKCFPDWEDMLKNLDLNSHLPKEKKEEPAEEKTDEKKEAPEKTEEVKEEAKVNGEKEEKKAE